jgi:hypothetical protein
MAVADAMLAEPVHALESERLGLVRLCSRLIRDRDAAEDLA